MPLFRLAIPLALLVLFPAWSWSQDKWYMLAEIRQDLSQIFSEIRELQLELASTATGSPPIFPVSGSIPRRVDALETELRENIAKLEELEYQIRLIAEDGAKRISELERKLVALEGGDESSLAERSTLGSFGGTSEQELAGGASGAWPPSELTEMDYAILAYSERDYLKAAALFQKVTESYPSRQITSKAHYYRGESLVRLERWKDAAMAYLDSYSGWPNGEFAPKSLYRLGESLGKIDRVEVACMTLKEVGRMFPAVDEANLADAEMTDLDCN